MSIDNLTIIGERINPGFKSSKLLLDAKDVPGLVELAKAQVEKGVGYLTINVGERPEEDPDFLIDVIKAIQQEVDVPLSFDGPSAEIQEICLKTYDPALANGEKPIMNSITEARMDMIDLYHIQPFKVVMLVSERLENGELTANKTAEEVVATAERLSEKVLATGNFQEDDIFIDVSIGPVATDYEDLTRMAVDSIKSIYSNKKLNKHHTIVGLSNISIMLPKKALDGSLLKVKLESAFLTLTVPYGLDTILGTPGRNYEILEEDDFVLEGLKETIALDGYDAIFRVQQLYKE